MMTLDRAWDGFVTLTLQSGLACLPAGAGFLLLRRASAAARHLLMVLTVIALLAIPIFSLFLPHRHIFWGAPEAEPSSVLPLPTPAPARDPGTNIVQDSAASAQAHSAAAVMPIRADLSMAVGSAEDASSLAAGVQPAANRSEAEALAEGHALLPQTSACRQWILGIWLLGVSVGLLRLLIGLVGAMRVTRRETVSDPDLAQMAAQVQQEIGLRRPIAVRRVRPESRLPAPLTWGWLRPTLLLPAAFAEWPQERRRMILLHELAHIQRADWLVQVLVQIARALYWFHPLVWWTTARLQAESERACDDTVLLTGVTPSAYAETLLEVLRTMHRSKMSPLSMLGMAHPPMEARVRAILSPRRRARPSRSTALLAAAGATACALCLASLQVGARPALAAHKAAPRHTPNQAAENPTVQTPEKRAENLRLAADQAEAEKRAAKTLKKQATEDSVAMRRKLEALEQLLVRNQQENAELRRQLKVLSMTRQQNTRANQLATQDALRATEMRRVEANQKQQAMLEAMLIDMEQQKAVLERQQQQAEELVKSGAATPEKAAGVKAQHDIIRIKIEAAREQLRRIQLGRPSSLQEQVAAQTKVEIAAAQARLEAEKEILRQAKARYDAGLVNSVTLAEAEAKLKSTQVEIDQRRIRLLQETNR